MSSMEHLEHLGRNLAALDDSRDLTLVAGLDGEKFAVHRIVMMASCSYLKALLEPNQTKLNQNEVILPEYTGETLRAIIDFCYTGHAVINLSNADDVMVAASTMELIHLEQTCSNFWNEKMDVSNCIPKLMFASKHNFVDLWNESLFFICENLDKIPIDNIVKLDPENFDAILKEDGITAAESDIFHRFVQWVQHDEANRSQFVAAMVYSFRLEHMPREFMREVVRPFFETYGCVKFEMDKRSEPISLHRMKNIYLVEMTDPAQIDVYKFNANCIQFEYFEAASFGACKNSVFSNGKLYAVVDDADDAEDARDLKSYDLITCDEDILVDAPINSISGPPISIGTYVYVFGEHQSDNEKSSHIFARFETEGEVWEKLEPLPYQMEQLSAVELDGLIYVAGKIDASANYSSNFWCYDPTENTWTEKAHPILDGHGIILCKANQSIFICNHLVGLLRYDATVNRWSKLSLEMPDEADGTDNFQMTIAIDSENNSYGILSTDRGHLFVDIKLGDDYGRLSNFMEYFLEDFNLTGTRLHLFIR